MARDINDIEKHIWHRIHNMDVNSDINPDEAYLHFESINDERCAFVQIGHEDAIAIAKHFKLKDKDLNNG